MDSWDNFSRLKIVERILTLYERKDLSILFVTSFKRITFIYKKNEELQDKLTKIITKYIYRC